MKLRPFFSYYGGKHRSAARYPAPRHQQIVDVCAGSAGYSTRYPRANVTLVDVDPMICGIWNYLIAATPAEILRIPLIAADGSLDDLGAGVPQEARTLVGFWLGKAGASPRNTPSPWMRSGKWPACFWGEVVRARIASQVDYIRHWKVVEGSYAEIPPVRATWFVDPPYQVKGRHYRRSQIDYADLARWCRRRPGQLIVCENEGATWLPFVPFMSMKTLNRKDGQQGRSREVIYVADDCLPCMPPETDLFGGGTAWAK